MNFPITTQTNCKHYWWVCSREEIFIFLKYVRTYEEHSEQLGTHLVPFIWMGYIYMCVRARRRPTITCRASYRAWSESLIEPALANSERLEPTDLPRGIPVARWCRHLKEPACVVGEHRQFNFPLVVFLVVAWDVGDTSICECFFRPSISISGSFTLSLGGFLSTFCSIFVLSKLLLLINYQ